MALLITATWKVYGIREMIKSCAETASSRSFSDDTSTDFGAAFLMSPINCLALDNVRQAKCQKDVKLLRGTNQQ